MVQVTDIQRRQLQMKYFKQVKDKFSFKQILIVIILGGLVLITWRISLILETTTIENKGVGLSQMTVKELETLSGIKSGKFYFEVKEGQY